MTRCTEKPRAGLTLRTRLMLILSASALVVGLSAGLVGVEAASRIVERQRAEGSVRQAASVMADLHLPPSTTLLERLRQVLGGEFAVRRRDGSVLAATLPAAALPEAGAAGGPDRGLVRVQGVPYRLASAPLPPCAELPQGGTLVMWLPRSTSAAAWCESLAWVLPASLIASLVALLAGWRVALGLATPVTTLAGDMRALAREVAAGREPPGPVPADIPAGGAPEVRDLRVAFATLLGELAASRRELRRASQLAAVGRLSAAVVHELRNPLSGIKMNARLLADSATASGGTPDPAVGLVLREVERMDLFLGELLALAQDGTGDRPDAGSATLAPVCLKQVSGSVLHLLGPQLRHLGIAVVPLSAEVPPVRGDERRVRQVILNLVLNAVDAMPGGGTLRVQAGPGSAPGCVRFEVRDSGPGVRLAGLDPFAPFVSSKSHGVGLGLYVCARSVAAMQGRIGFENPAGGGACFWFELPTSDAPTPGAPSA